MKKYILLLMCIIGTVSIYAQSENESEVIPVINQSTEEMQEDLQRTLNPPSAGDYYEGLSKKITFDRMIPPYGLEVTFDKTVHVIFPAAIKYVDLGSNNIVAGKAGGSENVIRVKAAIRNFESETNMAVITEEGSYYTFNIKYANEPEKLNIEMKDFMHDGIAINKPNNSMEIYLKELGSESPRLVHLINRSIYQNNNHEVKHLGCKRFGIQYILKGIYTHNGLLYLHTQIKNSSNVPFDIDFIRFKVVDKKMVKQTTIQETVIYPLRAYNFVSVVGGNQTERTVFTIDKITIPDDKQLVIELFEKNGGRNQTFIVTNTDLLSAKVINELKVK